MNPTSARKTGIRLALRIFMGIILVMCLLPAPAMAYIDPGTGSFILQGILAAIVGVGVILKIYWRRLMTFFGRSSTADDDDLDE